MNRVPQRSGLAFLGAIAGIALFSIMDMVMKGLTLAIGTFATLLWRSLFATLIAAGLYLSTRPSWPDRNALRWHVLRAAIMVPMAVMFFWGLARMPMAQAIALTFIAPLLALFLAVLLLKEPIGPKTVGASFIALTGVVVIFVGQNQSDLGRDALVGSGAVLLSAALYAVNIVVMRRQAQGSGPQEIAFFQSSIFGLALAFYVPFAGKLELPHGHWLELILAAGLAIGSLNLLAWAYARANASYLSTTEYSAFLWAILLGWLRFGESISLFTLAGATLIVAGCVVAARRSAGRAIEPEIAAAA